MRKRTHLDDLSESFQKKRISMQQIPNISTQMLSPKGNHENLLFDIDKLNQDINKLDSHRINIPDLNEINSNMV